MLQDYYEEVHGKQMSFDSVSDKTQVLLQNTSDSRITSQLTQLNSRYTTLHAFTKVRMLVSDESNLTKPLSLRITKESFLALDLS